MEKQHRKITGYRELDQVEIDIMNEVKALGPAIEGVLNKIANHIDNERQSTGGDGCDDETARKRMENATPERFLAMAKTELQTGLMYATRAVAQPEFF